MLFKKFNFIHQGSVFVMVYLLFLQIDINTPILAQEPKLVEPEKENFLGINLTLLIGIITASSAIIAAAVTSYFTKKSNMEINIRNDLRKKRIDTYSELFIVMEELAILSNSENLNYDQLKKIQLQFTNWYYAKGGGLLMGKYSQNAYIDFQKQLKFILDYSNKQTELSCYDNYLIKVLSYKLRVALIADIDVNATTLLGKNEKKKIDEETLKSYHKLFADHKIDDKDSDKPDYIKSYVKAMEEYYWKKFYKEKLKDYRKKIVLKDHRNEIHEVIKGFRNRFLG